MTCQNATSFHSRTFIFSSLLYSFIFAYIFFFSHSAPTSSNQPPNFYLEYQILFTLSFLNHFFLFFNEQDEMTANNLKLELLLPVNKINDCYRLDWNFLSLNLARNGLVRIFLICSLLWLLLLLFAIVGCAFYQHFFLPS